MSNPDYAGRTGRISAELAAATAGRVTAGVMILTGVAAVPRWPRGPRAAIRGRPVTTGPGQDQGRGYGPGPGGARNARAPRGRGTRQRGSDGAVPGSEDYRLKPAPMLGSARAGGRRAHGKPANGRGL